MQAATLAHTLLPNYTGHNCNEHAGRMPHTLSLQLAHTERRPMTGPLALQHGCREREAALLCTGSSDITLYYGQHAQLYKKPKKHVLCLYRAKQMPSLNYL